MGDEMRAREVFAGNLRQYAEAKQKTQADVAAYMNCSASTVSDWFNGRKYPRVDKMQRLADFFGVLISDLTREHSGPYLSGNDVLDEVDVAFYGDYKELSEDEKNTVRDLVRVMRERRANK